MSKEKVISTSDIDILDQAMKNVDAVEKPKHNLNAGLREDPAKGLNPKDLIGATKIDMTLIPPSALVHTAAALTDGASKYGPYNWRVTPIQARTYIAAAMRHLSDWLDGEEEASDSNVHHLGHVIATCAIVIDAQEQDMLVDDRPLPGKASKILERLAAKQKKKKKATP